MTMAEPSSARLSLTRGECLELLTAGGHGRVAATMKAVPVIIPVTFMLSATTSSSIQGPPRGCPAPSPTR